MRCRAQVSAFRASAGKARPNLGVALFSFPDVESYERYRRDVAQDEDCKAATLRFNEAQCFLGYERSFLVPIFE